ncbi:MAG: TerB family tellurite resistance protein [Methanobacteriota archaeon]|nr:MAG: TerB family tellurite resistance protein [Euryarchaeota archaeon]
MEPALSLPTEKRIILHLADFWGMDQREAVPPALTNEGIASAIDVEEAQVSTPLHNMVDEVSLESTESPVEGMKERVFVYWLTSIGIEKAERIKDELDGAEIPVRIGRVVKKMTVMEINENTSVHLTITDIVRVAAKVDIVNIRDLEDIEKRRKEELEETVKKIEDYTKAMMAAWQDGKMTATERLLTDELRSHLQIADEVHKEIESDVIRSLSESPLRNLEIYENAVEVALEDGEISTEEAAILAVLEKQLKISKKDVVDIQNIPKEGK